MRARILIFLALIVVLGPAGALPQAGLAQDQSTPPNPTPLPNSLYLPTLLNPTGRAPATPIGAAGLVTATVSAAEQAAAEAFWTREQMLAATPLDAVRVSPAQAAATQGAVQAAGQAATDGLRRGRKGSASGSLPDARAAALAQSMYRAEWARIAADDVVPELPTAAGPDSPAVQGAAASAPDGGEAGGEYSSTPPFASYYVNDNPTTWKYFPWITIGRLFFQIPGLSGSYACTGAVAYGRAVWTAGHCVYSPGRGWHTNLYFVPAYRDGAYPYGAFTVKSKTALAQWVSGGNLAYDLGMVAVNDRSGLKLSQWVGSLGFAWNQPAGQMFHAFGYPSNYSAGQFLVVCAASTFKRDPLTGPYPIGIGCDQGSGSSGGPWVIGYAPFKGGLTNYINGLNSYTYGDRPNELYGPYFGDGAKWLYDWGTTQ